MRCCFPHVGAGLLLPSSSASDVPVYSPSFCCVLILLTEGGMAQAEQTWVRGSVEFVTSVLLMSLVNVLFSWYRLMCISHHYLTR